MAWRWRVIVREAFMMPLRQIAELVPGLDPRTVPAICPDKESA
jgi:hypothetical protein